MSPAPEHREGGRAGRPLAGAAGSGAGAAAVAPLRPRLLVALGRAAGCHGSSSGGCWRLLGTGQGCCPAPTVPGTALRTQRVTAPPGASAAPLRRSSDPQDPRSARPPAARPARVSRQSPASPGGGQHGPVGGQGPRPSASLRPTPGAQAQSRGARAVPGSCRRSTVRWAAPCEAASTARSTSRHWCHSVRDSLTGSVGAPVTWRRCGAASSGGSHASVGGFVLAPEAPVT